MKLSVCTDPGTEAADIICNLVSNHEFSTLALPTGNTPLSMYRRLARRNAQQDITWDNVQIFMLDALYPQDAKDPRSFISYIEKNFLDLIDLPPQNFHILDSGTKTPEIECQKYEEKIRTAGGIDLAILGIGCNGHIAFNEPGTDFNLRTHHAELAAETKKKCGYGVNSDIKGLTMGMATIFAAKKIILLAKGLTKNKIIKRAVEGPVSTECPASILKNHQDCIFLLDSSAASLLTI